MGKETRFEIPPLLTTLVQSFGGNHAANVNEDTVYLFEEVPSLGIAGDIVLTPVWADAEPVQNFHIEKPAGSVFTTNLVGKLNQEDLKSYKGYQAMG